MSKIAVILSEAPCHPERRARVDGQGPVGASSQVSVRKGLPLLLLPLQLSMLPWPVDVLVHFVLPDEQQTWLGIAESELTLRRCAYICRPTLADLEVSNTTSKRISIPVDRRLVPETFESLR